jgi:predicted RNA-binding protein
LVSWLAVGAPENWETAFNQGNIWGLRSTQKVLWERIAEGDVVLFYATMPIKKIIGYGTISSKFKQDKPLWPEELKKNRVIWPLRFEFDVVFRFRREEWKTSGITHPDLIYRVRSGFQELSKEISESLIEELNKSYKRTPAIVGLSYARESKREFGHISMHDNLKEKLLIIGGLQKFIAEKEYKLDGGRLDVTWRRVERGVPTYVFEIQIGGNINDALAKLKHAFDLWNSRLYLIAKMEDREKVNNLLEGTFHEIRDHLKFITPEEVRELYKLKLDLHKLEDRIGIP